MLFDAWLLHRQGQPALQAELQARLLACEPDAVIAKKLAMHADAVTWYQRAFFHIADRLESPGWITHQVIGLHDAGRRDQLFATWKLLGFAYGPAVVDEIIFDFSPQRRPVTSSEVRDAIQRDALATLRRRAVVAVRTLPLNNPKVAMQLIRCFVRLSAIEKRDEKIRRAHVDISRNVEVFYEQLNQNLRCPTEMTKYASSGVAVGRLGKVRCPWLGVAEMEG